MAQNSPGARNSQRGVGVNRTKIVVICRMTESFVRGSLSFYVDMLSKYAPLPQKRSLKPESIYCFVEQKVCCGLEGVAD